MSCKRCGGLGEVWLQKRLFRCLIPCPNGCKSISKSDDKESQRFIVDTDALDFDENEVDLFGRCLDKKGKD